MLALIAPFQGCASMNQRPTELLPTRSTYRTGPFAIHSHKAMRHKDPIVQELESLTREVAARIGGPVPGQDSSTFYTIIIQNSHQDGPILLPQKKPDRFTPIKAII